MKTYLIRNYAMKMIGKMISIVLVFTSKALWAQSSLEFIPEEKHSLLLYAPLLLIGAAVFLISFSIFKEEEQFKASEGLGTIDEDGASKKVGLIYDISRPLVKRYFSPIVESARWKLKIRERYKRKLSSAGLTSKITPEVFFGWKLFLIIGFPFAYLVLDFIIGENWPVELSVFMGGLGFFYPNIWLQGQIDQRKSQIIYNMPFIVDMLALSVEAGLDFVAAMKKVIEKAPPSPLSDEFQTVLKEITIGSSRAEALRNMSWRCDLIQISSFVATLIAADSVGANIGPILKDLGEEIRQKRSSDIEKEGAKAATKILFPMMGLIVPAVIVVIFAPMVLSFVYGD